MYLLGFSTLILIILWIFQTVLLSTFYKAIKVNEIKDNASKLIESLTSENNLQSILDTISSSSDCYIEIVESNGEHIYLSGDIKNKISTPEKRKLLSKLETDSYIEYINSDPHDNEEDEKEMSSKNKPSPQSIVYIQKLDDHRFVLISSVISPVDATVSTLQYQLYYITAITLLLSILLAIIISKKISKPIETLNKSAKELAKGNYDISFSNIGYKEIRELSDTLTITASELNKVELLRQELMANISHDLRTPLSLIYGYAEIMHDFSNEVTVEQTQIIMDETLRLSSLVNDILDISKLESGIDTLNITNFNFTKSIKGTIERLTALTNKDGFIFKFIYDQEITILADEIKITQVFYNLLINAINYTGEDKLITISQTVTKNEVRIEIADTGEGISNENLPYIWDRYYKTDKNHKRFLTGTGLGLSIVKKIIILHNGNYGVSSTIGNGSVFWFSLKI